MSSKIIHVHAKCESFEIFEHVDEKKCVARLNCIKNMFGSIRRKSPTNKLVVNTMVVNPELQFV